MKLRRIDIQRIPGIAGRLEVDQFSDGLNVIVGPNGVGKSRMSQAIRGLLWNGSFKEPRLIAEGNFEHEGVAWHVERDGARHRWQRDGVDSEPPPLPAQELDRCFFLGLRDLLDSGDAEQVADLFSQLPAVPPQIADFQRRQEADRAAWPHNAQLERLVPAGRNLRQTLRDADAYFFLFS